MTQKLENGDVICVNRYSLYDHYGIYVKKGNKVIHYSTPEGRADSGGTVCETTLGEFLDDAERFTVRRYPKDPPLFWFLLRAEDFKVNNEEMEKKGAFSKALEFLQEITLSKSDSPYASRGDSKTTSYHLYSGEETVERARSHLGKGDWGLVRNNCQHFAVWCRTGLKASSQVQKACVAAATLALGALALVFYPLAKSRKDLGGEE